MKRWDIIFVRADANDPTGHPGVILSDGMVLADAHQRRINVLMGTKKPPAASTHAHQVLLDEADGLDHLTLVDCSLVYLVAKAAIIRVAGTVSPERRDGIRRRLRASLGLG